MNAPARPLRIIGSRLRELREAAGYSQAEVADAVGRSQNQVSRWELGLWSPTLEELSSLAALLGLETAGALVDALLEDE